MLLHSPFDSFCGIYMSTNRHTIKVLVPGAGLGRLAYDVAKLGTPVC